MPLSEVAQAAPLSLGSLLPIALGVARALARFHARGLVHGDLTPATIWFSAATGEASLARASHTQGRAEPREIIHGALAYMAPEQTGRLNRSVDSRTDLYSLGVVLYELATAQRPFVTTNTAELLHAHVAREPVRPLEHRADLPVVVSRIIEKLLAKSADGRYQTADGLAADLERCLDAWRSRGAVPDFTLGARDRLQRPIGPDRLVGREGETGLLRAAYERVATGGGVELALVRGWSGVGKSSVVHALRPLFEARGAFGSGKFDARRSDVPYATLIDALTELVRRVLCLPEPELAEWREAVLAAVGHNIVLVSALVPDVATLVGAGAHPPPEGASAKEAPHRLHRALAAFIGVFARSERPLTLFLDDLQWLDAATLDLVEYLVVQSDVRHLLLVGAYRANEVGPEHALRRSVERMLAAQARIAEIEVVSLALDQTTELLAATLQESAESLRPLAELVFAKSQGNPFFALQLVSSLAEEGLLTPSSKNAGWTWSLEAIRARRLTDDVATLVSTRLTRLSPHARALLERLACLDAPAEASTLAQLCELGQEEVAAALAEVTAAGLVGHNIALPTIA